MKDKFWDWFQKNKEEIEAFDTGDQKVFDFVQSELTKYNSNLALEISVPIDGVREIVISADGAVSEFDSVIELCEAAPKINGWKVIPFRPRMSLDGVVINYGPLTLDPIKMWICPIEENGHFDLILYFSDLNEENIKLFINAAYILLDMAIGEYYTSAGIRYLDHHLLPESPKEHGLKLFTELPEIFDGYIEKRG